MIEYGIQTGKQMDGRVNFKCRPPLNIYSSTELSFYHQKCVVVGHNDNTRLVVKVFVHEMVFQ